MNNGPKVFGQNISCAAGVLGRKAAVLLFSRTSGSSPDDYGCVVECQRLRTEVTSNSAVIYMTRA